MNNFQTQPSFPRRRESSVARLRDKESYTPQTRRSWISVFAGMTAGKGIK